MSIFCRMVLFLLLVGALCAMVLSNEVQGQGRPGGRPMNRQEQAEAAAVLKALTKDWALVDDDPEIDFLIFVNEGREELDFYPKKSLIVMMEQSGLIENLDPGGSSVRQPHVHYERDRFGWKQITEAGSIVFEYRMTSKGREFLRDAPRLTGKPVRQLRVATSPVLIPTKPLKVVTYDKHAIEKLVEEFETRAKAKIEALFSQSNGTDLSVSSRGLLECGPRLWQKLKSQAETNGLRPVNSLAIITLTQGGEEKSNIRLLEDVPLSTASEVRLFVKTLREVFGINGPPSIRRAERVERSAYPYQQETMNDDLPTPDLSGLKVMFIAEANKVKFLVLVENVPESDPKHFGPDVSWIELMEAAKQQD